MNYALNAEPVLENAVMVFTKQRRHLAQSSFSQKAVYKDVMAAVISVLLVQLNMSAKEAKPAVFPATAAVKRT